jgi:hypothetical protein
MGRILVVAVALLASGLVVTSTVQAEPQAEPQPQPKHFITVGGNQVPAAGWWKVGGTPQQRTIYRDNRIWVYWNRAYVLPYRNVSDVPLYWRAQVWYTNVGNQPQRLVCGNSNPRRVKEHIRRGGEYLGYVAADRIFCSVHPNSSTTLSPGETFKDWSRFHNVPWRGDRVSIEYGVFNSRTAFVNPWARHFH